MRSALSWRRLFGLESPPEGFLGTLEPDERVVASAEVAGGGGVLVCTAHGLWLPEGRRVGWHLISKATWGNDTLTVIEAEVGENLTEAVVLVDGFPRSFRLTEPGRVPEVVHRRVTGSIRARQRIELADGGAWLLRRAVAGADGTLLQVRVDPGTDVETLRGAIPEAARTLKEETP
jgi:hypothetical protein